MNKTLIWVLVSSGLLGVTLALYAFLFVRMEEKTIAASDASLKALLLENKQGGLSQNLSLLKKHTADIETIDSLFVREREVVAFTEKAEGLGREIGAPVTLVSLNSGVRPGGAKTLAFQVKAVGDFSQAMRVLKRFENFPARLDVDGVRMYRSDSDTKKGAEPQWVLEANITLLSYTTE